MELILKDGLPHQEQAINVINGVFQDVDIVKPRLSYMNPMFDIHSSTIQNNIKNMQQAIHPAIRGRGEVGDYLNLDIKMETGTGKTYVYTKTIFELHKNFGFNKFIIVVPSLAIKAGTQQFIKSPYVRRHFRDNCSYNCDIDLHVLEAKKAKKGKLFFPAAVRDFVSGSHHVANKIHVLITNMHLFQDKKGGMLVRDDYGYGVEGFYKPIEALKMTRPIVIIDEPHRFSKEQKTFEFIEKQICPQCIIRYGATFPEREIKLGKKKTMVKDYHNLLYNLSACDAFNQNLIKGVSKEHFEPTSQKNEKVKVVSVNNKASVNLHYIEEGKKTSTHTLEKGDPLSILCPAFERITITGIGKNFIELSNGQVKSQGEEFSTDIYSSSYQEQMIKLALERHFQIEKSNFNRKYKIKTLALFFIDDITSYRQDDANEKEAYLKNTFERLLSEKIKLEISKLTAADSPEYREYLLASQVNIAATHAGYFAQDNSNSDDAIAKEINEILFEKEKLLSIRNNDNTFNTRRFLFSKWTLKEGWDNPNVFTIVKLRSSGSENSKLQEVGRGLRLPVDEFGNRISNEEFFLNYIVDFTERDFAEELVRQINGDLPETLILDDDMMKKVAKKLGVEPDDLFIDLLSKKYIDRNNNINPLNKAEFFAEYPAFTTGLNSAKVKDRNKSKIATVKIRKNNYAELKELWERLNQKYFIYYEIFADEWLQEQIVEILKKDVFSDVIIKSKRDTVTVTASGMRLNEGSGVYFTMEKSIPYNEFLIRISDATNLPITMLHKAIIDFSKTATLEIQHINEFSMINFIRGFAEWKADNLQNRFNYQKAKLPIHPTPLTNADGSPKDIIAQGRVGNKIVPGAAMEKYLYDVIAFDSPLEKDNIQSDIEEVVVFGKIPRNSIRIPTINGGTYSPDFMYVVKKTNGAKELNIVVESKDVENTTNLRGSEDDKINCARVFFKQLTIDGYDVKFRTQLKNKKMKAIIDEVLGS